MMISKKAISPLIASILLIALSITVGALISAFAHDFSDETVSLGDSYNLETRCQGTKLEISKSGEDFRICHNGTNMTVVIANQGTSAVQGFKFLLFDDTYASYEYNYTTTSLDAGKMMKLEFPVYGNFNDTTRLEEMRLVPVVYDKSKNLIDCPETTLKSIPPSIIIDHTCG